MNGKRLLVIGLLGLFMISIFAGVVSANGDVTEKITSVAEDVKGFFSSGDGEMSSNFAWILLVALVAMLIYSIAGAIPFVPDNDGVRWAISIVVAVLSFLTISVADIQYILINYQALGIALTTFIPLVIIIVFTWEFRSKKPVIAGPVNKLILSLFVIYSGWNWIMLKPDEVSSLKWIYPATVLIALAWMFLETRIFFKVFKMKLKGETEGANQIKINDWHAQLQRLEDQSKTAEGETLEGVEKEILKLTEKIRSHGGQLRLH